MKRKFVASVLAALFILMLTAPPVLLAKVDVPQIMNVQKNLKAMDYDCKCTGMMDKQTTEAIQLFQKDHGLTPTGELTPETAKAIDKAWDERVKKAEQEAAAPHEHP
ncbi:MAG: peptidoglycan-binding domain-containing protein [bacterium]